MLGPYTPPMAARIGKLKTGIAQKLFGKRFNYRHSKAMALAFSNYFSAKLETKQFDYIIATAASCEIAKLKTNIPIIYVSDTTFKRSLGYHKALSGLTKKSIREGMEIEKMALEKSSLIVVSSEWARESVIRDFEIAPEKILVLPFGPNMANLPEGNKIKTELSDNEIKILFPAVYWENKGGEIAYNCLKELLGRHINARLIVVGCTPPEKFRHEKMEVIPFLDKNKEDDFIRLQEFFAEADFLILPTRFDCTPVVFCEASAFGLPSLCADTGGVRGHIYEGVNGFLIDFNDRGEAYAAKIAELVSDREKYMALRKSSRKLFEEKLNWKHWADSIKKALSI